MTDCFGCAEGIRACQTVPCWMLPSQVVWYCNEHPEIARRFDMSHYTDPSTGGFYYVTPGVAGREGKATPPCGGRCTFLTGDNLCELHDLWKPAGGQLFCCKFPFPDEITPGAAAMWVSAPGLHAIKKWTELVDYQGEMK